MVKEHIIVIEPGDKVNIVLKNGEGVVVAAIEKGRFNVQGLYPRKDIPGDNWRCEAIVNVDDWPDITFKLFEVKE